MNETRDLALQGLKYSKPDYACVNLTWYDVLLYLSRVLLQMAISFGPGVFVCESHVCNLLFAV